jgi:hypothetical protein
MVSPGDNSLLVHQSSLAVLPAETSGVSRKNGRRSENFAYQYLKYLKGSLTRRKILRHGTFGFTSHLKEVVPRIFIVLKNPSPRPGLNPRHLSPVANPLTTAPARRPNTRNCRCVCALFTVTSPNTNESNSRFLTGHDIIKLHLILVHLYLYP